VAAPTFQAAGTAATNTTGAISPAWPVHQTDDIALLFVETAGGSAAPSLTTANGFTQLGTTRTTGTGTAGTKLAVFWARATSAAMAAPTLAGVADHQYAVIVTFRGALKTGSPFGDVQGGSKGTASTTISLTTPYVNAEEALVIFGITKDLDAATAFLTSIVDADLTSITEHFDAGTVDGLGGGIAVASGVKTGAGAMATATATVTSSINAYQAMVLLPEPPDQTSFRFYADGTESGSTALATQDTNVTVNTSSTANLQLRMRVQEKSGVAQKATDDYTLQYSLDGASYVNLSSNSGPADIIGNLLAYPTALSIMQGGTGVASETTQTSGQSFTAGASYTITGIQLLLQKNGAPVDNMTVELLTGSMTGTVIATSSAVAGSTLVAAVPKWTTFTFTSSVALTKNTTYYVRFARSGARDVANYYRWAGSSPSIYSGGNNYERANNTWTAGALDYWMMTLGYGAEVSGYNSASLTDAGATTNRLGAGTGSFVAGKISEDGIVDDHQLTASNYTEYLYSLSISSSLTSYADTLDFRILRNSLAQNYTVTPRITVSKTLTKTSTLVDNFNDNSQDVLLWSKFQNNGTVTESSSQLNIAPTASTTGYSGYASLTYYDLVASSASVKVPAVTNAVNGAETLLALDIDATNGFDILVGDSPQLLFSVSVTQ
jgi:hypothetical protein